MEEEMKFPVDEITLNLVLDSCNGAYDIDEETGEYIWTGSDFPLTTLLDFLSGVTPEDYEEEIVCDEYGDEITLAICNKSIFTYEDVMVALIEEVARLRTLVPSEHREP